MRLALVSGTDGNLPVLEAVVKDIDRRGVDAVLNLGDSLSRLLLPLETAHYLMARDWVPLAGKHECQVLTLDPSDQDPSDGFTRSELTASALQLLASLKPTLQYSAEVLLCHGTPASDLQYFLETVLPTHVGAASLRDGTGQLEPALDPACRSVSVDNTQLCTGCLTVGFAALRPWPAALQPQDST